MLNHLLISALSSTLIRPLILQPTNWHNLPIEMALSICGKGLPLLFQIHLYKLICFTNLLGRLILMYPLLFALQYKFTFKKIYIIMQFISKNTIQSFNISSSQKKKKSFSISNKSNWKSTISHMQETGNYHVYKTENHPELSLVYIVRS